MSDSAPAKKVGSLRDRIAMFDKKPEADVAPAPASAPGGPRGKLGAWKPKPIEREPVASNEGLNKSEPSTTVGASSSTRESNDSTPAVAPERSGSKGMSAADARESITKGGAMSMKERMAALSGRGGFGGPPPPGPATPKSAFKRAPASHDGEEDPSPEPGVVDNVDEGNVVTTSHEAFEGALSEEEAEGEPVEKSEEELERERRAAIAARMARLGGTRVGIAPAFGRPAVPTSSKPARKPSNDSAPEQKHSQEAPTTTDAVKLDEELASLAKDADYDQPPAAAEQPVEPPKHIDLPEQSLPPTEVPLPPSAAISPPTTGAPFSPPAASQGSTPATSPPSMPIPAAPKRALPPRKKAAKATAPAATPKSDASGPAQQEEPTAPLAKTDEHTIERRPTLEADAPAVSELSTITISDAPLPESVVEAREDENHAVPHHTEARAAAGLVDVDEEKQYIDDDAPVTSHKSKDSEAHAAANLVDFESDQRTREEDEMKEHDDGLSAAEQVKHDAEDGDGSPFTAHAVHAEDVPALPEEKEYVEDIVTPHALDGASPAEPADAEEEDDASRRRRIAERLAKTGGVGVFSAPRPATQQHGAPSAEVEHEREHEEEAQDDEEDEDARRARIAERLARSGGRNAFSPPVPSAPQLKTSATEAEHQSTDVEPTTRPHVAKEQAQNPEEGDEPEPCDADYEAAEDKQAATSTPKPESALRQGKDKDRARVSHEEGETDRDKLALGVLRTPHDAPGPRSSYEDGDADDAGSNEYEQGTASIHAHRSQPRPHLSPTFAHDSARTSAHATTPARLHHAQPQAHMLEIETNIPDDAREDQFETAREAYSTVSPVPRRVASADDEDTHPAHPVARLRAAASESDAMVIGHIAQPPLHSTYSPPASRSNSNSFSGESPATSPKNSRPASPETDKPLAPRRSSVASSIVVEPKSPVPLASPRARSRSSTDIPEPKGANILPTPSEEPESESAEAVDDDADEEAARRQRIADKLIRMGGRNPLGPRVVPGGPRPARRVSVDVDEPLTEAPAPMQPQQTVEQRDDQPSPALRRAVPPPRSSIAYVGEPSIPPAARLPPPVPKGPPSIPDKEEDENEPSEEEVDNLQEDADATIDDDDDDPRTLPPVPQAETEPPAPPRVLRTVPPPIVSPAAAPFSDSPSPTRSRVRPPVPIAPRPVSTAPSLSGMSKRMSLPPTGALPAIPTPIQPPQPAQLDTTRRRTDSQIEAHAVIDGLAVRMSEDEQSPVATTMPHMEEESTDADDKEEELMAEDEPDPIDPLVRSSARSSLIPTGAPGKQTTEYSSTRTSTSPSSASIISPLFAAPTTAGHGDIEDEEEDEKPRRPQTLAERMAKLGAIKIGGPLPMGAPMVHRSRKQPSEQEEPPNDEQSVAESHDAEGEAPQERATDDGVEQEPQEQPTEEERRRAIVARLAAQGGMRPGMFPMTGVPRAPPARRPSQDEGLPASPPALRPPPLPAKAPPVPTAALARAPPVPPSPLSRAPPAPGSAPSRAPPVPTAAPARAPPVPVAAPLRSPPAATPANENSESLYGDDETDEVVDIDDEDEVQDIDEVYEVEEEEELSLPHPPPTKPTSPPPLPPGRRVMPPVPGMAPGRLPPPPPRLDPRPPPPPARDDSYVAVTPVAQRDEFVMVDDDELSAPPPPPRSGRPADILRSPPPAPAQASSAGRWEIPSFERDSTDLAAGLDESWNGDVFNDVRSVSPPAPTQSPPLPPPPASASLPIDTPRRASLDSSALTEISQRIGAQVLASAQALATLAKNRVIGDGTSAGYVQSVLEGVPSVAPVRPDSGEFGHVIFSQTASTVQLRKSDIAPGDVVHVQQAHFSGRRLLKNYKEDIEEAYGVVVEFERKGGKIRVLKANQSANAYPAVESHNWKLEDLKSGTIRVLRIGEAES